MSKEKTKTEKLQRKYPFLESITETIHVTTRRKKMKKWKCPTIHKKTNKNIENNSQYLAYLFYEYKLKPLGW